MGEARNRGTFEERKAQAIREGRVKKKRYQRKPSRMQPLPLAIAAALFGSLAAGRKKRGGGQ